MSSFFESLRERFAYLVSLPERTVRSLAAIAGGTTSLLTDTLFPDVLRNTTLYKIFVGDAQRFMIEKVAQIQQEAAEQAENQAVSEDYLQRKMVGGALETAGLLAMHFSPLWVFAIVGDAAAGSNVFLERLVKHLKVNGVIPQDARIDNLADLLATMQDSSQRSAAAIDTPPLSREEVNKLAEEMTESYRAMFVKAGNLVPRIEDIWGRMQNLADKENISIERLTGILTIDVADWGRKGIGSVLAVGQTGADLFGEKILDSYIKTLDHVGREGVGRYLSTRLSPFMQSAMAHFHRDKKTWTETLLGAGIKTTPAPAAGDAPEGPVNFSI